MESIRSMRLKEKGFGIETEMTVEAVRNGQRIMVVPVHYRKRIGDPDQARSSSTTG